MTRREVSSTMLVAVGYSPSTRTLELQFRDGTTYEYFGVAQGAVDALVAAPSIGRHVNAHILGQYAYRLVSVIRPVGVLG